MSDADRSAFTSMTETLKVSRVDVSVIVHATENPDRIISALHTLAPGTDLGKMTRNSATGHYGNPIQILQFRLSHQSRPEQFLAHFWPKMSDLERKTILDQLGSNIDDSGGLHLRIDKQEAVNGRVRVNETEPVRIVVVFDLRGIRVDRALPLMIQKLNSIDLGK